METLGFQVICSATNNNSETYSAVTTKVPPSVVIAVENLMEKKIYAEKRKYIFTN